MSEPARVRIIGAGRAGSALAIALGRVGWSVPEPLGRRDDPAAACDGVDAVVIATPDATIAEVARAITPSTDCAVVHLSGATTLEALAPHPRPASLHPLVALPSPARGADRLLGGAWFATAGDPVATTMAGALGGRSLPVPDDRRARYHAAAVVASNHLVALMGQVERIAASAGLDPAPFLALAGGSLADVTELGARGALTGPAARGDDATIAGHLEALAADERDTYVAMMREARRLAG